MPASDSPTPPSGIEVRQIRPDELGAWFEAFTSAFYIWHNADPRTMAEARRPHFEAGRTTAAFEDEQIVGTFRAFPTELTLPGGAQVPVGAITGVSVRPTHRRRGLLTAMAVDDIRRALDAGEAASVLIASEWPIYGRFGFGPATWTARWTVRTRAARFLDAPSGSVEIAGLDEARRLLPDIYDARRRRQAGEIGRDAWRWDFELGLREWPGRPTWRGSVAIHRDETGSPDGYARYHGEEKWEEGIPDNVLILDELLASSEPAELALWQYLVRMDLTATIRADTRRLHEALPWHLVDARAARLSNLGEMLWVRLLDVPRLLSNRTYAREATLTIELLDEVAGKPGPAAGRFRLEAGPDGASCRPTADDADLTLGAASLGAAVLGGTPLRDATRARPMVEHRPGAMGRLDDLLQTVDEPWCTTWF